MNGIGEIRRANAAATGKTVTLTREQADEAAGALMVLMVNLTGKLTDAKLAALEAAQEALLTADTITITKSEEESV